MKKFILAVFIFSLPVLVGAQNNPALVSFTGFQYNDSILIRFTMRGGFSCNGIDVQRSSDSLSFTNIGDIQGICGSPDFDIPFEFTDASPLKNADNFYRLDLKNFGYSQTIKVHFMDFNIAGYIFFPNPCFEECTLYFESFINDEMDFLFFDLAGKIIESKKLRGTNVIIDSKRLARGIYRYSVIRKGGIAFSGKFVVL